MGASVCRLIVEALDIVEEVFNDADYPRQRYACFHAFLTFASVLSRMTARVTMAFANPTLYGGSYGYHRPRPDLSVESMRNMRWIAGVFDSSGLGGPATA